MNKISFAHILFTTGVPGKPRLGRGASHMLVENSIKNKVEEEKI
jgi:hypothetical protein